MSNKGSAILPMIRLNTEAILNKADSSADILTYESSLSGVSYLIDRNGGVMILDKHGYYRVQWNDLQVICAELEGWILPEAERWERS